MALNDLASKLRSALAEVLRLHYMRSDKSLLQVYDYVEFNVPLLTKMFNRRSKGYNALGYTLRHD